MAFITKGNKPEGKRSFHGRQGKKGARATRNFQPKNGIAKKQKAKVNEEKNIASVK